jgi:hypothetical protein
VEMRVDLDSTDEAHDGIIEAITELLDIADGRTWDAQPNDVKLAMLRAIRNHWVRAIRAERRDFIGDIGTKFVTQGLRSTKHQELVRKWEREGKKFPEIVDVMKQVEKDSANRAPPGITPKTSIPAIIKAADAEHEDDDELQAEVAAAAKKQAKKQAKKARKANSQQIQQQQGGGSFSLPQSQKGGNFYNPNKGGNNSSNGGNFNNSNHGKQWQNNSNSYRPRKPTRPCSFCQNEFNDPAKWHWDSLHQNDRNYQGGAKKGNMSAGGEINVDNNSAFHACYNSAHLN